jgi:hypothetical protein
MCRVISCSKHSSYILGRLTLLFIFLYEKLYWKRVVFSKTYKMEKVLAVLALIVSLFFAAFFAIIKTSTSACFC